MHFTAGYDLETTEWWHIDVRKLIVELGLARSVDEMQQLQLIEPHKHRQGAVTMVQRSHRIPALAAPIAAQLLQPQFYKNGVVPPVL